MEYFQLEYSLDKAEIGSQFPQIQKMSSGYDYDAPNSVHSLARCIFKFPDFEPNLDSFVLHRGARLTDLLSAAVISVPGLLVSERLMLIFKKFNLVPCKFYNATVIDKSKRSHKYYWMHIVGYDFSRRVNYRKSTFFLGNFDTRVETVSNIGSLQDLLTREHELRETYKNQFLNIKADKIILDQSVSTYSLFSINGFDFNYFVDEDLKAAIVKNSISGIKFQQAAALEFTTL
jgi:hypothetical protein